jgi:hypothetical protein
MEQKNETLLSELLQEFIGDKDVLSIDFKPIDETTTKDQLDFKKVRGSVRLASRRLKTCAEVAEKRNHFVNLQIP